MKIAMDDLNLKRLYVVHAGDKNYQMGENIYAVASRNIVKELTPLF